MKKRFFLLLLFGLMSIWCSGQTPAGESEEVVFEVGMDDPEGGVFDPVEGDEPNPRSPILCPRATLDENVLLFTAAHSDFTLQLLDEDGYVVYSVFVPSSTTQVVLPATFSGEYELRLLPDAGSYYFYTYIYL